MIAIVTPIFAFGAWLMARVPSERLTPGNMVWEVYIAFPILAGCITTALTTMGYFMLRVFWDFNAGRDWSALLYMLGVCATTMYIWIMWKLLQAFERRGARKIREKRKQRSKEQSKRKESIIAEFCKASTRVHEKDDD